MHKITGKIQDRDGEAKDVDLEDLFCRSGKRFEMGIGLSVIKSEVIDFKPVNFNCPSRISYLRIFVFVM